MEVRQAGARATQNFTVTGKGAAVGVRIASVVGAVDSVLSTENLPFDVVHGLRNRLALDGDGVKFTDHWVLRGFQGSGKLTGAAVAAVAMKAAMARENFMLMELRYSVVVFGKEFEMESESVKSEVVMAMVMISEKSKTGQKDGVFILAQVQGYGVNKAWRTDPR